MKEKTLIKGKQYDAKKLFKVLVIIGAVISLIIFLAQMRVALGVWDSRYETYLEHQEDGECYYWYESWETCSDCQLIKNNPIKAGYVITWVFKEKDGVFIVPVAFAFICWLIYTWLLSNELTVTDKRIFGKVAWGKRVDLPLDKISSVGISVLKTIAVGTSSGKIKFSLIKNRDEVYDTINELLLLRQKQVQKQVEASPVMPVIKTESNPDELRKYKQLLDDGIISQEEFVAKKKQLLGL